MLNIITHILAVIGFMTVFSTICVFIIIYYATSYDIYDDYSDVNDDWVEHRYTTRKQTNPRKHKED